MLLLAIVTNLIVVTASPIAESETVLDDGTEVAEVTAAQLDRLNAQDLTTALRQIPGVTVSRYSPIGNFGGAQGGSVYVRGMGTSRPGGELCTYVDGAPHESGVWGHPLLDSLPLANVERITVYKNPMPGRFGGTFAAIDLETRRRREPGYEGEAEIVGGRYGTLLTSVSAGAKEGPVDAYAGSAYQQSDGARDNSEARLWSNFAHLGWELSAEDYLEFDFQQTTSRVHDPGDIRKQSGTATDYFDLDTELYNLRYTAEHENFRGYSLLYFDHGKIDWEKADPELTDYLNFGVRNRYEWQVWENLWLVGALDVISDGGESGKVNGRTVETAPYLGMRYDWEFAEDWTLTPSIGARESLHTEYRSEAQPEGALKLDYAKRWATSVSASRSVHYPGLYVRALALNDIHAEEMTYFGWNNRWTWETLEALVTVYRQEISDRLERTATGYLNTGDARSTGVEASLRYRPTDSVTLFAGGAYARADREPVSRLPRWTFSAGATWKLCEHLEWTIDGQYIDAMYAYSPRGAAAEPERLRGDFLFNTRVSVPFEWRGLRPEIFAALENFTDRRFEYYPGYPMPGIMYYLGFKLRF